MTDIHQNISSSSNSSYSYKSLKYWCSNCNRQFSQLCLEGSAPSRAQCPRCNLYADPTPQAAIPQASQTNSNRGRQPPRQQAASSSSQPQAPPQNQRQPQQDQEYVYYRQPVMDPFGRVYMQTYRMPANPQNQQRAARQQQEQQRRPQQQANNGGFFSQLFGNIFGFGDAQSAEADPNNNGPAPAPQEAINKLQQVKFDQHQHSNCEEDKCCPVCQEDYIHGESLVRLPCGHDYHGECVKTWLKKHNSCPMCRKEI